MHCCRHRGYVSEQDRQQIIKRSNKYTGEHWMGAACNSENKRVMLQGLGGLLEVGWPLGIEDI